MARLCVDRQGVPCVFSLTVKKLQEALIAAGYSVGPAGADGKLGENTVAALGRWAASTRSALVGLGSIPVIGTLLTKLSGPSEEDVKAVQREIATRGPMLVASAIKNQFGFTDAEIADLQAAFTECCRTPPRTGTAGQGAGGCPVGFVVDPKTGACVTPESLYKAEERGRSVWVYVVGGLIVVGLLYGLHRYTKGRALPAATPLRAYRRRRRRW